MRAVHKEHKDQYQERNASRILVKKNIFKFGLFAVFLCEK
ncbi:hypothetical protein PRUB_a1381 [Pseudoalteromonas rubra]|uniref:Uncharacterized protein n=1 Tax=Pseudoalteromonas rubra TaxID=43658 RepID=A0A8T0C7X0_9GAMM|nr:hypothetical protein PRUB_a1381 [Pseudoalteromonas rubra]